MGIGYCDDCGRTAGHSKDCPRWPASSGNSELLSAVQQTSLLQAVRFYAEQASYSSSWKTGDGFHAMEDKGRVARNALKAIGS